MLDDCTYVEMWTIVSRYLTFILNNGYYEGAEYIYPSTSNSYGKIRSLTETENGNIDNLRIDVIIILLTSRNILCEDAYLVDA